MKKNFVRSLVVAVMAVVVLCGCGNQQTATTESNTQEVKDFPEVNITDEEFKWLCRLMLAEKWEFPWGHATLEEYYKPTEEERQMAYLMTYAMACDEESTVQMMMMNVAINTAIENDMDLIEVFTAPGKFSGMHDGVPAVFVEDEDGTWKWVTVTEDMLTKELKDAVDLAFFHDYTEGAIAYCYATKFETSGFRYAKDYFQKGNVIFVREF